MRYAKIDNLEAVNGVGAGVSLYVQYCPIRCNLCHNPGTWSLTGGEEWTDDVEQHFMDLCGRKYVDRVSFLGGEPLAEPNYYKCCELMHKVSNLYKEVWLYSGFNWNVIWNNKRDALFCSDVAVIGPFMAHYKEFGLPFRGSTNQLIIDCKLSIERGIPVVIGEYMHDKYPEIDLVGEYEKRIQIEGKD